MKVAVLSESAADEAAVRILVEGLWGAPVEPVGVPFLRSRGWPSVEDVLPAVLRHLHYHTDADVLALVVDSNHSPPHTAKHNVMGGTEPKCRLCQLRDTAAQVLDQVRPVPGRPRLSVVIGLAVPSLEAWLLCGLDPRVTEAAWINGLQAGRDPYTKNDLKRRMYGTDRPSLALEMARMTEHAARVARDLALLQRHFPAGFGALAESIRRCRTQ